MQEIALFSLTDGPAGTRLRHENDRRFGEGGSVDADGWQR
jgi:hypothetical protein